MSHIAVEELLVARRISVPHGALRDELISILLPRPDGTKLADIEAMVRQRHPQVASSSVRSYLNNHVPELFERVSRGVYRMAGASSAVAQTYPATPTPGGDLYLCDALNWLRTRAENSVHAVVTDPPYGLVEYSEREKEKLRAGRGGVWRIPPSFDGVQRSALPRFTTLGDRDMERLSAFFEAFAVSLERVLVPGANVLVATNPLVTHVIAAAMVAGGLEMRGQIMRLVMTMRGGDRPKGAHEDFPNVSVMPRSQHEPWLMLRKRIEGTVAQNLRKWGTGGFRRISDDMPFGDVIRSAPTKGREKALAPHPSLKPQALMRELVRGVLPLDEGVILDPFAGSGSTLAACAAVGRRGIGIEIDPEYYRLAVEAIPRLAKFKV